MGIFDSKEKRRVKQFFRFVSHGEIENPEWTLKDRIRNAAFEYFFSLGLDQDNAEIYVGGVMLHGTDLKKAADNVLLSHDLLEHHIKKTGGSPRFDENSREHEERIEMIKALFDSTFKNKY